VATKFEAKKIAVATSGNIMILVFLNLKTRLLSLYYGVCCHCCHSFAGVTQKVLVKTGVFDDTKIGQYLPGRSALGGL
jgi:hypothetical protein